MLSVYDKTLLGTAYTGRAWFWDRAPPSHSGQSHNPLALWMNTAYMHIIFQVMVFHPAVLWTSIGAPSAISTSGVGSATLHNFWALKCSWGWNCLHFLNLWTPTMHAALIETLFVSLLSGPLCFSGPPPVTPALTLAGPEKLTPTLSVRLFSKQASDSMPLWPTTEQASDSAPLTNNWTGQWVCATLTNLLG